MKLQQTAVGHPVINAGSAALPAECYSVPSNAKDNLSWSDRTRSAERDTKFELATKELAACRYGRVWVHPV